MTAPGAYPRLGLGVTGPHAGPAVAPAASVALVRAALDLGVTLFDTGPMYGDGEGERRLGMALAGAADAIVCTKARTFPLRGDDGLGADIGARIRRSLEDSLVRLGRERADVLLLHGPRMEDVAPGLAALSELKHAGLVGAAGVCGRGPELDAALELGVDVLMAPADNPALLSRAAARHVPVLAIETMRGRDRWRVPVSLADLWYLARSARDALIGGAPPPGAGVAAALAMPAVASVIVQTTRLDHLRDNVAQARL